MSDWLQLMQNQPNLVNLERSLNNSQVYCPRRPSLWLVARMKMEKELKQDTITVSRLLQRVLEVVISQVMEETTHPQLLSQTP